MTQPAWDLDAPVDRTPVGGPVRVGPVLVLAVGLAGVGLGALTASALAPPAAPRAPTTGTLTVRTLYVGAPTSAGGSSVPTATASAAVTNAVVVFRLQVHNEEAEPIRVTALELDGVNRTLQSVPLDLRVTGHSSAGTDVTARPDCSPGREPAAVRAWLRVAGEARVRIAPARALSRSGGLCSQLDSTLPHGWRDPLQARSIRTVGEDLEITVEDLSSDGLSGLVIDGELRPTVFIGDQLLPSSALVKIGQPTRIRLEGPSPCLRSSNSTPVPSTVRLLVEGDEGLQQRLVVIGPELTRWLRPSCTD